MSLLVYLLLLLISLGGGGDSGRYVSYYCCCFYGWGVDFCLFSVVVDSFGGGDVSLFSIGNMNENMNPAYQ